MARFSQHSHGRDYAINSTASQLKVIAGAIHTYILENGHTPGSRDIGSNEVIPAKTILNHLVHTNENARLISPRNDAARTNAAGAIVDSWDREIHFMVTRTGNSAEVLIWSDGPNQRDDRCRKDDIYTRTDSFQVSKPSH